ncbi:hypothetical protein Cni_G08873 [Canna indica]|uniref:Uncharacterized protein n=1 Tax=Canna indica TaxID=4628 RepID=A0AAQ3K188_9LILI|nr:hypothetical protein Cni_G08873 [Canna indica]
MPGSDLGRPWPPSSPPSVTSSNLITGVTKDHRHKMRLVYAHFILKRINHPQQRLRWGETVHCVVGVQYQLIMYSSCMFMLTCDAALRSELFSTRLSNFSPRSSTLSIVLCYQAHENQVVQDVSTSYEVEKNNSITDSIVLMSSAAVDSDPVNVETNHGHNSNVEEFAIISTPILDEAFCTSVLQS